MKYIIEKTEQYTYLQVQDEKIDAIKAPQLKTELITINAEGVSSIILDLSLTKFVDSSGLSAILTGNRVCESSGGLFVLVGVKDHVEKLIKISQLDKVLTLLPTKEEAIDAIFLNEIEGNLKED